MMVRRPATRHGLTLLEVLVAMAIFVFALASISQLISVGANDALEASLQADATRLVLSKLAEVEAGVVPPDGPASGTFDFEAGWQWQIESSQTDAPNVFLVTVTVSRQPGGRKFEHKAAQMVFDSRQMGKPGEIAKPTTTGATS